MNEVHVGPEALIIVRVDPLRVVSPEVYAAEADFLRMAQGVWDDVDPANLGTVTTTWKFALARWLAEVDAPDAEHTDFWRDLDRGLHEQFPEEMAHVRAQLTEGA